MVGHASFSFVPTSILIVESAEVIRLRWVGDRQCDQEFTKIKLPPNFVVAALTDLRSVILPSEKQ